MTTGERRSTGEAGAIPTARWPLLAPILVAVPATIALLVALSGGGGAAPQPLEDPGAMVRWGLPAVKLVYSVAAAATVGALLFMVTVVSPSTNAWGRARKIALAAALSWATSSAVSLVLAFFSLVPPSRISSGTLDQFIYFCQSIALGQVWLANILITTCVVVFIMVIGTARSTIPVLLAAYLALAPMAATGHAAGSPNHSAAVAALALHIGASAAWVGGLLTLAIVGPTLGKRARVTVERFSRVALICFIIVSASGVIAAFINLGTLHSFWSPYGAIVLSKSAVLGLLGLAGAWNRMRLIKRLGAPEPATGKTFWKVIAGELALIGVASGLAAGLARTPAPAAEAATVSAAQALTGRAVPPPLNAITWLSEWDLDPLWALVAVAGIILYLSMVQRAVQRGINWPVGRTVCGILAFLALLYVTNGSGAVYQEFYFAANVANRLALCLLVPLLLMPARMGELIRLVVTPRGDGTIGIWETAKFARSFVNVPMLGSPSTWALLLVGSLAALYFTPALEWTIRDPFGYQLSTAYFLLVGVLLAWSVTSQTKIGQAVVGGVVTMIGLVVVSVMLALWPVVLAPDWFATLSEIIGNDPVTDQSGSRVVVWGMAGIWLALLLIATRFASPSRTGAVAPRATMIERKNR